MKRLLLHAVAATVIAAFATATMAEEQVVKIGSQSPLTGHMARVGTNTVNGIKVAVKLANEQYDGQYQFKLLVIDDETSPAKAVAAVEKLASQGVVAITGGYGSGNVGPASGAAHDLGIPYITSGALAKGLTQRGFDNFFQLVNLGGYAKAVVGYINMIDERAGVDTVSILYSKTEGNANIAHIVGDRLKEIGKTVYLHGFESGAGSYTTLVNRVRLQEQPDVLVLAGYENDYIGILKAGQLFKPDIKAIIGTWSLATSKMNNEFNGLVQGVASPAMLSYPPRFTNDAAQAFADAFKKMHGHMPDYLAMFGYVQTRFLIDAIVRAAETGELTGDRIAHAMHSIDTQTLIGRVAFDEQGMDPYFEQRVGQHQGGSVEIVWPQSAATAEVVLPGRPW